MSVDISVLKVLIHHLWTHNNKVLSKINLSNFRGCYSCEKAVKIADLVYCDRCYTFKCRFSHTDSHFCCKLPHMIPASYIHEYPINNNITIITMPTRTLDIYRLHVLMISILIKRRKVYYNILGQFMAICKFCQADKNVYTCVCSTPVCSDCATTLYQSKSRPCRCSNPCYTLRQG